MSVTNTGALKRDHFQGNADLFGAHPEALVSQQRQMLEKQARDRFALRNVLNLVDSSTGAAGMTYTIAAATEIGTVTVPAAGGGFQTGDGPFRITAGTTQPDGLLDDTDYYVERLSATTFHFHLTKSAAMSKATPVAVTDTGTGTLKILALGSDAAFVETDLTGLTTGFTPASWNLSVDDVSNACSTLMGRCNLLLALIGDGGTSDNDTVFTDGAGTIAAVDQDLEPQTTDTDAAAMPAVQAGLEEMDNAQRNVIIAISKLRVAVGLGAVPEGSRIRKGVADSGLNLNDLNGDGANQANTDAVVTDATTVLTAPLEAAANAHFVSFANNIALLADQLDDVTARVATTSQVVEGVINQSDFADGSSVFVTAPVSGRITKVESIVIDEVVAGEKAITFELGGSAIAAAALTIVNTAIIGEYDVDAVSGVVAPGAATTNYVNKGERIEIVGDATPTGGAALVRITIDESGEDLVANPILSVFAAA